MKDYSFVDLYEDFMALEVDNSFFDLSVNGIYFWELIRREIYIHVRNQIFNMEITRSAFDSGQNPPARSQQSPSIKKYMSSIPDLFPSGNALFDKNVLFFNMDDKQMKNDEEKESFIKHHFSAAINNNSIITDDDLPDKQYKYIHDKITKPNRIQDNKLFKSHIKLIEDEIKTRFDIKLDLECYTLSCIREFNKSFRVYNMILSVSDTQAVIMRGANRGLLTACKEQKIPTIQLTQAPTKSHASFEFNSKNINYFSDHLFVPGDSWKSEINYPIAEEDVYVVGNPYHELKRKETNRSTEDAILIISQPGLQSEFLNWAAEIEREKSMDVILKIHPKANSTKIPDQLINSSVSVCQEEDLYELFSKSVLQIGAYSSAVLEGANLGLKTIIIDGPWVTQITSHLPDYIYEICNNPSDVSSCMDQTKNNMRVDSDYVYAKSSKKRMQYALDDIGINK